MMDKDLRDAIRQIVKATAGNESAGIALDRLADLMDRREFRKDGWRETFALARARQIA